MDYSLSHIKTAYKELTIMPTKEVAACLPAAVARRLDLMFDWRVRASLP